VTADGQHRGGTHPARVEIGLYARVFAVNAFILVVSVSLLAFTPISIDSATTAEQLVFLFVGLAVMLAANAALLRLSLAPLRRLADLMRTADLLRPGVRLRASGSTEIAAVISAFNSTLERLEAERRISTQRVINAQETERRRIAQELHDQIGQNLTAVVLELDRAQASVDATAADVIADAQELARETLDDLHRISYQLRPAVLDDFGLISALETLCSSISNRVNIDISCEICEPPVPLEPQEELAFYRVAQEALTNAIRHSNCSSVVVGLTKDPRSISLVIRDDGVGMGNLTSAVSGVRGMRERAVMIGAQLILRNRESGGLEVVLLLPREVDAGT
jgi:two-component system, NarL family, sensor histidine kinase UhpB